MAGYDLNVSVAGVSREQLDGSAPALSPPDRHRLGRAVTGDEGDQPGDVSVLQRGDKRRAA